MKPGTLGAVPPNERDILKRGGRYRKPNAVPGGAPMPLDRAKANKSRLARCFGQDLMRGEHKVGGTNDSSEQTSGTSVFDPVLCELVYRWFCPPGGAVLDPFAGGSVRGIVAAQLGFAYTGIDLRAEQVVANQAQAETICDELKPRWICGDSRELSTIDTGEADLIFSCPPYGDLEVYSEDARDLSTLPHAEFVATYRAIIAAACAKLKPDRFACFVVGDFRDGKGFYRNFVSATIGAFEAAGAKLYNEAVLVTAVGSLPIRVGRQFKAGRKLGKTHQNVLAFFKGDPRAIKRWPVPDFGEPEPDLPELSASPDTPFP